MSRAQGPHREPNGSQFLENYLYVKAITQILIQYIQAIKVLHGINLIIFQVINFVVVLFGLLLYHYM